MHRVWGKRGMGALLAVAALTAGCGSSGSSNSERTRLTGQVNAQFSQIQSTAPDLVACVSQHAGKLPIAQLRAIANPGANPSLQVKQIGARLDSLCISQGQGINGARNLIVAGIVREIPHLATPLPPSFTSCLEAKARQVPPTQLSQLLTSYATQGSAAAQANAQSFGVGLAHQCFGDPAVVAGLRGLFVSSFRTGLQTSKFSAAFKACLLKKANQVPASEVKQMALDPAGANALGVAIGKRAAKACIASGAKP
jgi:hypothetical protein